MEKKIKKIIFLDLDYTLITHPEAADALKLWEEKFGVKHHNIAWWNTPESLDTDIFSFERIEPVLNYLDSIKDGDTLTVLLTNRPKEVENEVLAVLNKLEINLDIHTFKTKSSERKSERVHGILEKYPDVREVFIFDDLYGHLLDIYALSYLPKFANIDFSTFLVKNDGNEFYLEY